MRPVGGPIGRFELVRRFLSPMSSMKIGGANLIPIKFRRLGWVAAHIGSQLIFALAQIDEMPEQTVGRPPFFGCRCKQSPEPAYDLGFFDEFARAAGWTERASLENPELRQPS
jgi:hypothetical protein